MRAVMVTGPGEHGVETLPDPGAEAGQVVVEVHGCGICGTDRHIVEHGLPIAEYPVVPGHEPWGEVVAVGAGVSGLAVGSLVAIEPSLSCGRCAACLKGRPNLCARWGSVGITENGAWADFVAVPARSAVALAEDYPIDCGAVVQPIGCALHGLNRLGARPGAPAIIYGGGTIGLTLAILLELRGASSITVVETNAERRRFIAPLTAARVIDPSELGDEQAEYVIDATGAVSAIESALAHTEAGGTMLVFGIAPPDAHVRFSAYDAYRREITVVGSISMVGTFGSAVDLVARHGDRFRPLVTHSSGLDDYNGAVAALSQGDALKVALDLRSGGEGRG
jgi:NADPH2:quinone reductase